MVISTVKALITLLITDPVAPSNSAEAGSADGQLRAGRDHHEEQEQEQYAGLRWFGILLWVVPLDL